VIDTGTSLTCRVGIAIVVAVMGVHSAFAQPVVQMGSEVTLFTEDFEGATPPALPANWAGSLYQTATSASNPVAVTPHGGSNMLVIAGNVTQYVWNTTAYDCTNYKDLKIRFWMHQDTTEGSDVAWGDASPR